jgi:Sugar (and other) transporter
MMMGELFASDVKGVASAIAVMFNWTLVFIITKTFGMMMSAWGAGMINELLAMHKSSSNS